MNKKMLKVTFTIAVAMMSAMNVFNALKQEALSDIALVNVEALADNEVKIDCIDNGDGCYNDAYWYPTRREK